MKVNQKGFAPILVILAILVILGIGVGAYYFGKSSSKPITLSPSPSPTATITLTPTATIIPSPTITPTPTATPNSNLFTSQTLGVSFYYTKANTGVNNSSIAVKEIGNKIYVYSTSGKPEDGQYLEVFSKDKNQSLIDVIKQKILTGYSLTDCIVGTAKNPVTGQTYPASYEIAEINVPGPFTDLEAQAAKASKCPEKYVTTNGISYFLEDSNHPDKFIYLSIGQYPIDSGIGDKLWQTTIKFLP